MAGLINLGVSDYELLARLFTDRGIKYEADVYRLGDESRKVIDIENGYPGFHVEFVFTDEGILKEVAAYE